MVIYFVVYIADLIIENYYALLLIYGACMLDTQPLVDAAADDDYSWMPYQMARAEYIPFQQKLAMEDEAYFVPSVVECKKFCTSLHCRLIICARGYHNLLKVL